MLGDGGDGGGAGGGVERIEVTVWQVEEAQISGVHAEAGFGEVGFLAAGAGDLGRGKRGMSWMGSGTVGEVEDVDGKAGETALEEQAAAAETGIVLMRRDDEQRSGIEDERAGAEARQARGNGKCEWAQAFFETMNQVIRVHAVLGEGAVDHVYQARGFAFPAVVILGEVAGGEATGEEGDGIGEELVEGGGERSGLVQRHEQACGGMVGENLTLAGRIGSDDGETCAEVLEDFIGDGEIAVGDESLFEGEADIVLGDEGG